MAQHRTVFADCGMACRRVLMGVDEGSGRGGRGAGGDGTW